MLPLPANRPLLGLLNTEHVSSRSTFSRRLLSGSVTSHQARERIRPIQSEPSSIVKRPCLEKKNPYLPASSVIGIRPKIVSTRDSCRYPIRIPRTAVDPKLLKKSPAVPGPSHQALKIGLSPEVVLEVRETGELQVREIVQDWVRNELNVMGTIREETIEKFIQLLLNPSTLAPLAIKLKLRTDGEERPIKASLHAPRRIVPAATRADIELTQLFYYFIGSLHRSLPDHPSGPDVTSSPLLKKYVIDLLRTGLPHTSLTKLMIRASELSGQSVIGIKKGHARAELRVAQLSIWGERRSKKLSKLVPDQKRHRNALKVRKAELLKQRWRDEEQKMIHWRRRMLEVTAAQKADSEAARLHRQEHARAVAEWRRETYKKPQEVEAPKMGLWERFSTLWRNRPSA